MLVEFFFTNITFCDEMVKSNKSRVAARQAYAKHTTLQTRNGRLSNKKDIDIRKEDIEFFTRTLQQSFPPTPQPNPIPTTPSPIETPAPTPGFEG